MQVANSSKSTAAIFLYWLILLIKATTSSTTRFSSHTATPGVLHTKIENGTCEFRTINYITDRLPQKCLKNAWSAANSSGVMAGPGGTVRKDNLRNITATVLDITSSVIQEVINEMSTNTMMGASQTLEPAFGLSEDPSVFLSFEEWKKQMIEKAEQKDANSGQKKNIDFKKRESDNAQNNIDHMGGEGVIDLQFSSFGSGDGEIKTKEEQTDGKESKTLRTDKKRESYRSKDAGKTCKERFSYSSFDAGATVLKTHSGAKNAKNILIENKDSYMLSECFVENKFIIIELSEDIWIDTVVLANYEFFSSMIRTFRISVSDRYPVKMEKWKEVGTYMARNSREIQAFLVENPQIWARYIRFEFLDHYGTEYYCPLSLVRVHGTRMLESWKETEAAGEDEDMDEGDYFEEADIPMEVEVPEADNARKINEDSKNGAKVSRAKKPTQKHSTARTMRNTTSWKDPGFYIFNAGHMPPLEDVCLPDETNSQHVIVDIIETITVNSSRGSISFDSSALLSKINLEPISPAILDPEIDPNLNFSSNNFSSSLPDESTSEYSSESSQISNTFQGKQVSSASPSIQSISGTPTLSKNKTSTQTTSSSSSLPTIQESFFKAVSRRLTLLESNSTLSLTYISEATSHLHQAFASLAKNITRTQLSKATVFLEAINKTVISELRSFRQQYDEIWQSTVISLESQKDENRREILAVSERLNILAQEVVWQRRMNMVQSVLLLFILGIVIFSHVSTSSDQLFIRPRSRSSVHSRQYNGDSPSESGSPGQWPEMNGTPNQTPTRSQNCLRNPNLSHIYDNHKNTNQTYTHHSTCRGSCHSPSSSYFDQAPHSPFNLSDRELTGKNIVS